MVNGLGARFKKNHIVYEVEDSSPSMDPAFFWNYITQLVLLLNSELELALKLLDSILKRKLGQTRHYWFGPYLGALCNYGRFTWYACGQVLPHD